MRRRAVRRRSPSSACTTRPRTSSVAARSPPRSTTPVRSKVSRQTPETPALLNRCGSGAPLNGGASGILWSRERARASLQRSTRAAHLDLDGRALSDSQLDAAGRAQGDALRGAARRVHVVVPATARSVTGVGVSDSGNDGRAGVRAEHDVDVVVVVDLDGLEFA